MEFNSYDFSVSQKSEGKWLVYRILMITLYVLFAVGYFIAIYVTRMIPLGAFIPLLVWILIFFTWRYVTPDYKYTLVSGVFTLYTVYSKKEKKRLSFRICDAEKIAPVSKISDILSTIPKKHISVATPTKEDENAYGAIFTEGGIRRAVIFVPTDDAVRILRFYNSKATDISGIISHGL